MNSRFVDWIWHIRGSLPLGPEQSSDDVFDRLDPLFRQSGTSHRRTHDTLTFRKKEQAAQDKMSIFDGGVLQVRKDAVGSVLHYHMTSRALLFCFLAPLLFLGFAQLTIAIGKFENPSTEAGSNSAADSAAAEKSKRKNAELPQHPIDKFLGAPAPEKPKDKASGSEEEKNKPSPTPAYVFAAIFAVLYVVGRILEDRLIKRLFRNRLLGS